MESWGSLSLLWVMNVATTETWKRTGILRSASRLSSRSVRLCPGICWEWGSQGINKKGNQAEQWGWEAWKVSYVGTAVNPHFSLQNLHILQFEAPGSVMQCDWIFQQILRSKTTCAEEAHLMRPSVWRLFRCPGWSQAREKEHLSLEKYISK